AVPAHPDRRTPGDGAWKPERTPHRKIWWQSGHGIRGDRQYHSPKPISDMPMPPSRILLFLLLVMCHTVLAPTSLTGNTGNGISLLATFRSTAHVLPVPEDFRPGLVQPHRHRIP